MLSIPKWLKFLWDFIFANLICEYGKVVEINHKIFCSHRPAIKSENTQENLWGTCPTEVASSYTPQRTGLPCCVVPGGRPRQAPGRYCRLKYSDKCDIRECNSETQAYETLLASFLNEQHRTELEHTAY